VTIRGARLPVTIVITDPATLEVLSIGGIAFVLD